MIACSFFIPAPPGSRFLASGKFVCGDGLCMADFKIAPFFFGFAQENARAPKSAAEERKELPAR